MPEDKEFQQRIQKIEGLVRKLETLADPNARACAQELVQSLMDLHGAGLEQMMEIVWQAKEPGNAIIDGFARDELAPVCSCFMGCTRWTWKRGCCRLSIKYALICVCTVARLSCLALKTERFGYGYKAAARVAAHRRRRSSRHLKKRSTKRLLI
jgi:hypothetical protein